MIKSIHLQNFQSHKDTKIELSDGVNAIVGKSDSGKSALFRALYWVIYNKPGGDAFRSYWGGDTAVTIALTDGTTITRKRTDKDNCYILNGKELRAFGSGEPPKEIQDALCIGNVNVQTQMDAPFLLGSTGGEVARYLNKIVNLDIIDTTISNINKELLSAKRDHTLCVRRVETLEEKVAQYDYIEDMEKDCALLKALMEKQASTVRKRDEIENMVRELSTLSDFVDKNRAFLSNMKRSDVSATKHLSDIKGLFEKTGPLQKIIYNIQAISTSLAKLPNLEGAPAATIKLSRLLKDGVSVENSVCKLQDALLEIETGGSLVSKKGGEIKKYSEEFNALMPDICPLCGKADSSCEQSHQNNQQNNQSRRRRSEES